MKYNNLTNFLTKISFYKYLPVNLAYKSTWDKIIKIIEKLENI